MLVDVFLWSILQEKTSEGVPCQENGAGSASPALGSSNASERCTTLAYFLTLVASLF